MAVPHPKVEAPSSPADWTRRAPSHIARTVGEGTMRPYLTAAEVAQIELQLAGLASLLEFGCGEATIVAARQVRRIVSVESDTARRSEEHTSELQSLMRSSYAVFCLKKKKKRDRQARRCNNNNSKKEQDE